MYSYFEKDYFSRVIQIQNLITHRLIFISILNQYKYPSIVGMISTITMIINLQVYLLFPFVE